MVTEDGSQSKVSLNSQVDIECLFKYQHKLVKIVNLLGTF